MMTVSVENKKIGETLREVFQGKSKYSRFADEKEKSTVDILTCSDSPWKGVVSYGTIGLSDYSAGKEVENAPLGVEIVGASYSKFDVFPNILATCAFTIINSKSKCEPGSIFPEAVSVYIESPMKHVLFVPPFVWKKELNTLYFKPEKVVAWLQAVPVSDEEMAYSSVNEKGALEKLFERQQIDVFDLMRNSVI